MSQLVLQNTAVPETPGQDKISIFSTVDGFVSAINEFGETVAFVTQPFNRNVIINGSFDYAQRQDPAVATIYNSVGGRVYGPDRWFLSVSANSIHYKVSSNMNSSESGISAAYVGDFIRNSAGTPKFLVGQVVESLNMMHLRGFRVRLTCKMKWEVGAAVMRMGLLQVTSAGTQDVVPSAPGTFVTAWGVDTVDPTFGTNLALVSPIVGSAEGGVIENDALTCTLAAGWITYSVAYWVPINARNLIPVFWSNIGLANGIEIDITEVDLHAGGRIRDWMPMNPLEQLRLNQRYFAKTFPPSVVPAWNTGPLGTLVGSVGVSGASIYASTIHWNFPSEMRKAPTITTFNPEVSTIQIRNYVHTNACTNTAGANITIAGCDILCTGDNTWVSGETIRVHAVADAEI